MKTINYTALKAVFTLALVFLFQFALLAQAPITEVNTTTSSLPDTYSYTASGAVSSPLAGNTYNYKYGAASGYSDNLLTLNSFTAGGIGYRYEGIPVDVYFRRVNNASVSGNRDLLYYFGSLSGSNLMLKAPYEPNMNTAFTGNGNLLRGSDNLFSNTADGNGNNNNIERLDVVISAGLTLISAEDQGFAVMERGGVNQHDSFVVSVIMAVDGSGTPTSYSNVVRANSASYGTVNPVVDQSSAVVRRDGGTGELKVSTTLGNQGIGGVLFNFSVFGISDGQTIYGYSGAAIDFPSGCTGTNLIDYTNSTYFPRNTNGTNTGGIDMIALTGIVREINLSGNVFNDFTGLTNSLVDGSAIQMIEGNQLYVNLVNQLNIVVLTTAVLPDGSFSLSGAPLGNLMLQLSTNQGTPGNTPPAVELDPEWVYVSDKAGTGAPAQNNNGIINISVGANNITELDFGIQKRPTAQTSALPAQQNPGGTIKVTVPASLFANGDFDGGAVSAILIADFPIGANTITINGTEYDALSFPPAGVTVPVDGSGQPTQTIEVDPVDGDVTVVIEYFAIDNTNTVSSAAGSVSLPFTSAPIIIVNQYPAMGFGTLAYEDLWPAKGDYDFNDLVIDYQFEITTDGLNMISQVDATFIIKAFGASYENGFGFQLSDAIEQADMTVTGYELSDNIITLNPNGTEAGQSKPTIIVYDNAFNQMQHPGVGIGVNTTPGAPYVAPDTLRLQIVFAPNTYTYNDLDIANFNPFIFVNQVRSVEVHLPNYAPTDLFNAALLGTLDDDSDATSGRYFKTITNLPWAINIYETFDYPIEKQEIIWAHLKFAEWATSGGVLFPNWYQNISGYRNNSLIYQAP